MMRVIFRFLRALATWLYSRSLELFGFLAHHEDRIEIDYIFDEDPGNEK